MKRTAAALLLSVAAASLLPAAAHAETPAVEALIKQADYWRSKSRTDLAEDALRRARALSPNSAEVRAAEARLRSPAATKPKPAPAQAARVASPSPTAPATRVARTPPAPAAPARADRTGNARAAGFAALEQNDLATAEARFTRALSANRSDADAAGGLGLIRLRQERFAEAADLLQRASRGGNSSQWAESLATARFFAGVSSARSLVAEGRLDEARAAAESAARLGYADPVPALEVLADIYERQGRYGESAELYRQAAARHPKEEARLTASAARVRALAAVQTGDDLAAEREFRSALLVAHDDPWTRYEYAKFLIKRGNFAEYEEQLRVLTVTGQPESLFAAALLNRDLGRIDVAGQLLQMIPPPQRTQAMRSLDLSLKSDSAVARAKALAAMGRGGEAVAALRQLSATPGMTVSQQAAIAGALFEMGDVGSAQAIAEQAAMQPVDDAAAYEGLIGVLAQVGRDDLAWGALQRAGQLAGASPEGQASYARMAAALAVSQADRQRLGGQYAAAFDTLQSAWSASPDNVGVLRALARLYQSGAMPGPAAQTFQLVLARDPRDRDALIGLAGAAQAAGDPALSRDAQRTVLAAYPADYEVRMALADVERARGDERAALRLLKDARELYARQNGGSSALIAGNPFATNTGGGTNPFRNAAVAVPAPVNPFALSSGARLQPAMVAYQAPGVGLPAYSSPAIVPAQEQPWQQPVAMVQQAPYPGAYAAPVATGPVYSADPVMAKLQGEIAALSEQDGPRAELQTSFRDRSGETGLSALSEVKGTAKISTGLAGGRIYARADAVLADSGRPTGSGLARFGRNATAEAQAIVDELPSELVDAETQSASGVAIAIGYESELLKLEAGTNPIGMGETELTFHAAVSPRISATTVIKAFAERQAVGDSIVSYAGTIDPVSGERWGQVMRTGGGLSISWDRNGFGFYGDARYNRYEGTNVLDNSSIEANLGGYARMYTDARSTLTGGLNLNYQSFDNNQGYFTFGHGGYFSPKNFLSVGFPVRYAMKTDRIDLNVGLTPGFQSYRQDQVGLYPTDADAQAVLDALKGENSDVRSYYDSLSKTGFALSADGSIYYRVAPSTRVGAQASYNSFGEYSEFRSLIGVEQSFGGGQ
jgi:tetratricopeptide (TPR) repeat protein